MNKKLAKRIAKEARALAYECSARVAPRMIRRRFCSGDKHCAVGLVLRRSAGAYTYAIGPLKEAGLLGSVGVSVVYEANDFARSHEDRMSRLVFPLLALADKAEECAS